MCLTTTQPKRYYEPRIAYKVVEKVKGEWVTPFRQFPAKGQHTTELTYFDDYEGRNVEQGFHTYKEESVAIQYKEELEMGFANPFKVIPVLVWGWGYENEEELVTENINFEP